jgi:hypothetical protein
MTRNISKRSRRPPRSVSAAPERASCETSAFQAEVTIPFPGRVRNEHLLPHTLRAGRKGLIRVVVDSEEPEEALDFVIEHRVRNASKASDQLEVLRTREIGVRDSVSRSYTASVSQIAFRGIL